MNNMNQIFSKYFSKNGKVFCNNMSLIIPALLRCGKANTALIAKEMSKFNNKDFHTNDTLLFRFLQSNKFQIDDSFWRMHVKMLFDFMKEQKLINCDDPIQVNVDFTSHEDNFLILSASMIINNKAVALYFTTRVYPKKKDRLDQIKMETAFIKGLRHVLSKQYKYTIVADRGFGNYRFASLCQTNNFDYVLRVKGDLNIKIQNPTDEQKHIKKLKDLDRQNHQNFKCYVEAWKADVIFDINTAEGSTWFLLKSQHLADNGVNTVPIYEQRFKIEKLFQDVKSSGFDIEKNKIRKYDRFRRMLYLTTLSHLFVVVLGNFLDTTINDIKKNSALHVTTLLAFLNLGLDQFPPSLINPSESLMDYY